MEVLILLFVGLTGVAALLASIAIWAPRATLSRSIAVLATAALIPLSYLGLNELLSKPKPIERAWFEPRAGEATLLGVSLNEGKAIYLWLQLDGSREPRSYVLPWHSELAERLQQLIREAIEMEGVVRLANPFAKKSLERLGELNIHVVPPNLPPHKQPPPPAQIFDPRELRI